MKKALFMIICCFCIVKAAGQELFINTEPASNMATKSLGIRLNNYDYENSGAVKSIFNPELMYGLSSKVMLHVSAYIDNKFTDGYVFRGINLYGKYRFYAKDEMQRHFRMAAYSRISEALQSDKNNEVNIEGDYRGVDAGIVATQLLHKLAISSSLGYTYILPGENDYLRNGRDLEYTLSFGYLTLPKVYSNYKQTNMNLIFELLGKTQWAAVNNGNNPTEQSSYYLDAAPGIQFIIMSRARIDLSWRFQAIGDMTRLWYQQALIRLEYNVFNV